ncbi:hypothetical protein LUZ61_007029 [Rhynchospora tenuis]|uniref:PUM-HD domain-containing protein n=1 Tax=Rhynchospora tenuis TaxID=198213 RepID=A0AAD5ZSL4_9POAL|nr:hypothetical protein LUZ61_007029 [Rhynchospora tenuis]
MITESPLTMMSEMGIEGFNGDDLLDGDLNLLLREQRMRQEASDRERELNMYRSGSAPPTIEGSLSAVGNILPELLAANNGSNGFLSEEELRSDPAYLSYYYSHVNLNPRLPPPVLSKEDWRSTQRLKNGGGSGFGGIGDRRKQNREGDEIAAGESLFSQQLGFGLREESEGEVRLTSGAGEWVDKGGDGLIGLSLGRQKSFADVLQDNLGRRTPSSEHPSRNPSRNAFLEGQDTLMPSGGAHLETLTGPKLGPSVSQPQTFASVVGSSLSRSSTPDPQLVARAPSPGLPPVGVRMSTNDKKINSAQSSFNSSSKMLESDDILAALSSMNLSSVGTTDQSQGEMNNHQVLNNLNNLNLNLPLDLPSSHVHAKPHSFLQKNESDYLGVPPVHAKPAKSNSFRDSNKNTSSLADLRNAYHNSPPASSNVSPGGSPSQYQSLDGLNSAFLGYGLGSYPLNPSVPSNMMNILGTNNLANNVNTNVFSPQSPTLSDIQNFSRVGNAAALSDPLYIQYLKASQYMGQGSYTDLTGVQKAYLESLLQSQKQYGMPLMGKNVGLNTGYNYGSPSYGTGISYPVSPLASPLASGGPGSPLRIGERSLRFPFGLRNLSGSVWQSDLTGGVNGNFPSSLLEEFKSNKTRCFELAEIAGHVVEFSADQYGSRFIQQKLETATVEEKDMVYDEIMPHALSLMTDVFGNYVVQKFFEHGSASQRRELADQLFGHVLALSLQMYGCRVIQKAIEVVDLDQKIKMVAELDGHVMRCVRDQNGNHVIQKCIECVPQENIHFIVSTFYDQVVPLSMHPYGCRVIQRVLEHCDDPKTQKIVMDEILQSVCILAQDQYGNYVVQHVLEHGKPDERSLIIEKLAGQIVKMSQQKFASNVVEKCLTFGGPAERQHLINEMLGTTDENEPLQAMMKDQFANYVVQKVLETCNDDQRELILSRIKVHLNALKKYTYGKHIVARVEKLVAAGERRLGQQAAPYPS